MDTGSSRASKQNNGIFLRISKICKLRSVGVFSSTEPKKPTHDASKGGVTGNECDELKEFKVHPQPFGETLEDAVISKLFARVSALKCAYIRLQEAHIPYEPKKIRSAGEVVAVELELLSELKDLYSEMQEKKTLSLAALKLDIEKQRGLLEELQSLIHDKDQEIIKLRWAIEELDCRNAELREEVDLKASLVLGIFPLNQELTPNVFSDLLEVTYKNIHEFGKPLISLMKVSGWDLGRAAGSIVGPVIYAEKSHKKFAFEAYLSRRMLHCEEDEPFELNQLNHVMSFQDPFDALVEDPDSSFGRFCHLKYLSVVQPKMEGSFFGNSDQRAFVLSGRHPRTPFYQAFARMARWVWALQAMMCSFIPKLEAFYAKRGEEYSGNFMESIANTTQGEEKLKVGFTVMPGFKLGSKIIRCKVYLCKKSNDIVE